MNPAEFSKETGKITNEKASALKNLKIITSIKVNSCLVGLMEEESTSGATERLMKENGTKG